MNSDEPTEQEVQKMQDSLERAWALHEQRVNAPYDGVLGSLPSWLGTWHQQEFIRIRDRLLSEPLFGEYLTPEKIIAYINAFRDLGAPEVWSEHIPDEVFDDIGRLEHYRYAVSLGPEKGTLLLVGPDALTGRRSATGYQQREDFQDKNDFQGLFNKHKELIRSIADIDKFPDLSPYRRSYVDKTLRRWIAQIAPGHLKAGRPRHE